MSHTPELSVGHVHLRVSDVDQSIRFYEEALGLKLTQRYGPDAAFLAAGGYHHHVALNAWQSKGGSPPPAGHTGLFHVAFLYPSRKALGAALRRALGYGVILTGSADHGCSQSVYFNDPDGNGIELYCDRPPEEWPRDEAGYIAMGNDPLDIDALLAETD